MGDKINQYFNNYVKKYFLFINYSIINKLIAFNLTEYIIIILLVV